MSNNYSGQIVARGPSCGVRESKNERGQITGYTCQFVKRNSKGGIEVISVRLPEGADPAAYAEGQWVELVVDVSSYEGTLYYRATREQAPPKAEPKPADRTAPKAAGASL